MSAALSRGAATSTSMGARKCQTISPPSSSKPNCVGMRLCLTLLLPTASALVVTSGLRTSSWAVQRAHVHAAAALPEEALQAKLASLRQKGKPRERSPRKKRDAAPLAEPQVVDAVQPMPPVAPASDEILAGTQIPAWLEEVRADGLEPLDRLRAMVRERDDESIALDASALAAATEFLNDYFGAGLLSWAMAHTEVGKTAAKKNCNERPRRVTHPTVLLTRL